MFVFYKDVSLERIERRLYPKASQKKLFDVSLERIERKLLTKQIEVKFAFAPDVSLERIERHLTQTQ